jgi:hypothetical protein
VKKRIGDLYACGSKLHTSFTYQHAARLKDRTGNQKGGQRMGADKFVSKEMTTPTR